MRFLLLIVAIRALNSCAHFPASSVVDDIKRKDDFCWLVKQEISRDPEFREGVSDPVIASVTVPDAYSTMETFDIVLSLNMDMGQNGGEIQYYRVHSSKSQAEFMRKFNVSGSFKVQFASDKIQRVISIYEAPASFLDDPEWKPKAVTIERSQNGEKWAESEFEDNDRTELLKFKSKKFDQNTYSKTIKLECRLPASNL